MIAINENEINARFWHRMVWVTVLLAIAAVTGFFWYIRHQTKNESTVIIDAGGVSIDAPVFSAVGLPKAGSGSMGDLVNVSSQFRGILDGSTCQLPLTYSINQVDPNFRLTEEQVQRITGKAEAMWDNGLGINVLEYAPNGVFKVNLVWDERQENVNQLAHEKRELGRSDNSLHRLNNQYMAMRNTVLEEQDHFKAEKKLLEEELDRYNREVADYNRFVDGNIDVIRSNTPNGELLRRQAADRKRRLSSTFAEIRSREKALREKSEMINQQVEALNIKAAQINEMVSSHNQAVERVNVKADELGIYTQGESYGKAKVVNVFAYHDEQDLVAVFAHEFGHQLGLGHGVDSLSLMYPINQKVKKISAEDVAMARQAILKMGCGTLLN